MLNTLMRWQAGVNAAENQIDPRELFMMLFGGDAFHHIFGDDYGILCSPSHPRRMPR